MCVSGYVAVRGGVGNARSLASGPSHTLSPPDLALIDLDLDPKGERGAEGIEANAVSQFIVLNTKKDLGQHEKMHNM